MQNVILPIRVILSFAALAICWLVSTIAFALHIGDDRALVAFFIWSVPFFAVGWILAGIPIIAMGVRILKIPKLLLGVAGAVAGLLVMLLPVLVMWVISPGDVNFTNLTKTKWTWSDGDVLFVFAAGIGASATILYSWLLSRAIDRTTSNPNTN